MILRDRERAALADLYTRYGFLLRRRARMILRDQLEADDALQEVFVKVMRADMNVVEEPLRFLYRVVDNVCLDALRRRKTRPRSSATELELAELVTAHPDVPSEERDWVLHFLGTLDELSQTIALRAFVDGMNQSEIAEETGYSRVTINKRLHVIRERARSALAQDSTLTS